MQFDKPFIRIPLTFDGDALAAEVRALPEEAWVEHPDGFAGNNAVRLVTPGGQPVDAAIGPMGPTSWLEACPYIREIMAELDAVWGRSRLMGLAPGAEVPDHVDIHYYWQTHIRLHIPVITHPDVQFTCDGETIHMAPGECWTFDSFRRHGVRNRSDIHRVHLVLDTVGGSALGELIAAADDGASNRRVGRGDGAERKLRFEQVNSPEVMSPWEMSCHVRTLAERTPDQPGREKIFACLDRLIDEWRGLWAEYGASDAGLPAYQECLSRHRTALAATQPLRVLMQSGALLTGAVERLLLLNAISPLKSGEPRGSR